MDSVWPKFRLNSANTGQVASTLVSSISTPPWTFDSNSSVYSSPSIDLLGNIYFSGSDGNIFCVSSTGSLVWKYTYALNMSLLQSTRDRPVPGVQASPTIDVNGFDIRSYVFQIVTVCV